MNAGTSVLHGEWNLEDKTMRIFQIWILPDCADVLPAWGTRLFPKTGRAGTFATLTSGHS